MAAYPCRAGRNGRTIRRVRVLQLALPTAALDQQRTFYAAALGLPIAAESTEEIAFQVGASRLVLRRSSAPRTPYHFAVNVPENRFADAKAWAAERASLIAQEGGDEFHFPAWNAHALYFLDAEENVVELIARHDLPNASRAPFGPASLLEISEVGLPVRDVADAVRRLARELGQPLFSGDGRYFAAVGDQRGLFIVVPLGRPWFPTDSTTAPAPLTVAIAAERDSGHELPGVPYQILARASGSPSSG